MAASIYPPGYSATVDDVARLHSDLFSTYKRVIPPVYQQNHAVRVRVSLFLLMIHDLDMKNQVLTTSGWLNVNWEDEFLQWNISDYGGVEEVTVSQSAVWLPDILVENTMTETSGVKRIEPPHEQSNVSIFKHFNRVFYLMTLK